MPLVNKPYIICLTPVKNEAWILDRFLQCTSLWADTIIIADQMSTDGSREIALKYAKVLLIDNNFVEFNEPERQKLLLNKARQITSHGQKKLIIALDADECLTGNFVNSPEWQRVCASKEGTIIRFDFLNLHPDGKQYWLGGEKMPWGFIDDNISQHSGSLIHSYRIPLPINIPEFYCETIKVLHYQFTDWARMSSKHRWYQCYELLNRPHIRPLHVFRMYHHMYGFKQKEFKLLEDEWFSDYEEKGIDMKTIHREKKYRWDDDVEVLFQKHGRSFFSSLVIWKNVDKKNDPRTIYQRLLHKYLFMTQPDYKRRSFLGFCIRFFDKFLKFTL